MATITDKRRAIRDRVDRSNELNCCISQIPSAGTEPVGQPTTPQNDEMIPPDRRVETVAKIAIWPSSGLHVAVVFLPGFDQQRSKSSPRKWQAPVGARQAIPEQIRTSARIA
jgi:hypothetical protein